MNVMIIQQDNGYKRICSCYACKFDYKIEEGDSPAEDKYINTYYSVKHACDEGWVPTNDIKYCPPDKEFVWICPDCWED